MSPKQERVLVAGPSWRCRFLVLLETLRVAGEVEDWMWERVQFLPPRQAVERELRRLRGVRGR